jgi:hypothetical protein
MIVTIEPPGSEDPEQLLARIRAFSLDEPGSAWSFAGRLARENRWTPAYAGRVVEEYRNFMFLAVAAGHQVTPSDQVDQAWHLHLLHSRSYWERFCPEVLGRRLHHEPSRGGSWERVKFAAWYERTLASYRRLLGRAPPADIWPEGAVRFGEDLRAARVNLARHWVIAKPPRPRELLRRARRQLARQDGRS